MSTRKVVESASEKKANKSNGNISLCASHCENRNGQQFGIVESAVVVGAFCERSVSKA